MYENFTESVHSYRQLGDIIFQNLRIAYSCTATVAASVHVPKKAGFNAFKESKIKIKCLH